jgi:homoserine kinase type II
MNSIIKEVTDVLKNYALGEFKSIKRLTSGYANVNYKLVTSKGKYLYRICKERPKKNIIYETNIMDALKQIKFLTAFPIRRKDKKYITETNQGNVLIYEFIGGEEPEINSKTVKEIARAVAKLNSFQNWKSFRRTNALRIDLCKDLIKKFDKSKNKYPEMFDYFIEETNYLLEPLKEKIPIGLVHGDVFPDNTKFKDDKLLAILDFEEVCTDNVLFDIGVTINGFCFRDNEIDSRLLAIFLKEYTKIRKISPKEYKLLPYYIQWGAHAMIYWHLKHLLNKKDSRKLKRAQYLINRIKMLRKSMYDLKLRGVIGQFY